MQHDEQCRVLLTGIHKEKNEKMKQEIVLQRYWVQESPKIMKFRLAQKRHPSLLSKQTKRHPHGIYCCAFTPMNRVLRSWFSKGTIYFREWPKLSTTLNRDSP